MRGLEDALARIARRDDLRERANGVRGGAHRVDESFPDEASTPSVSPVVDEVTEALQAVVRRNPGVFATVVVQEADTAWSVWIGEWDGTLRTRVTRLDPDPPAVTASDTPFTIDSVATPTPEPNTGPGPDYVPASAVPPAPIPAPRQPAHDRNESYAPLRAASAPAEAEPQPATYPGAYQTTVAPPLRPVNGPAMNDRVAGRIAELLRREASRESRGVDA